jgi:glucose-6-phosphate isomerase
MPGSLHYDSQTAAIPGYTPQVRRLSDLRGVFCDPAAYERSLAIDDTLLYRVTNVEDHQGDGDLHYGLGILMPGKVGDEYFMTKGHLHEWRPAAEVYVGLRGRGLMLLEDERTGECQAVALEADTVVYVPGYTAHRTVNVGAEPLVYWGILPSAAGHDYAAIAARNFRQVVVEIDGQPVVMERQEYLQRLKGVQP